MVRMKRTKIGKIKERKMKMKSLIEVCLLVVGLMSVSFGMGITKEQCSFKDDNLGWYVSAGSFLFKSVAFTGGIRGKHIGIELGMASPPFSTSNHWNNYGDERNYQCPHNNVTDLGNLQNPYYGGDLLYFINPGDKISFYAGLGVYISQYRHKAYSNVTGWVYDYGLAGTSWAANPSLGVQFFITKTGTRDLFLGISYNLLRGLSISLGNKS